METSAELLYLLKLADKEYKFGFTDDLERNQCLQWLFFWHGSGAPYQGQTNHFKNFAKEKIPCTSPLSPLFLPTFLVNPSALNVPTDRARKHQQMPSSASRTKLCAYTACSKSICRASTRANRATTWLGRARANTQSLISVLGRG